MKTAAILVFSWALVACVSAQGTVQTPAGRLSYTEDWGYVTVRPSAHTFWWLFQSSSSADSSRPLMLWLQGGPGSDSTGFGNLDEIGPKDVHLQDRNYTWLQLADLVFVDNPVGAGFSYVDDTSALTTNVQQIGADLVTWAKTFFQKHPEYQTRNFYVVCESYGGKMTAEFAKQLQDAIDDGAIKAKLAGIALGDSWISPMDFVNTWASYLHAVSYLDDQQLATANKQAAACQNLVDQKKWYDATTCWNTMENVIGDLTGGVSWYNILKAGNTDDWSKFSKEEAMLAYRMPKALSAQRQAFNRHLKPLRTDAVSDVMNNQMRKKFGIIPAKVRFGAQGNAVFSAQWGDFMTPNYDTVDNLLNRGVSVTVYNGQLDLICDTLGVELWMKRLTWSHRDDFLKAPKHPFASKYDTNAVDGFWKEYSNLKMAYILRGGHMVAHDAPWAALEVIKKVFGQ